MADKKISGLTSATTPLAGTEVVPLVQSSTTKKATVENLLTSVQPSGTANGIVYLNGTKIATSGSALSFDGTNLTTTGNVSASGSGNKAISATSNGGVAYLALGSVGVGTQYFYGNVGGAQNFMAEVGGQERFRIDTSNITITTTNLKIGTAGKGIDFSANTGAPGMTSELLTRYEEGTWTPVFADALTGGNASGKAMSGVYTRIGNLVRVSFGFAALDTSGMTAGNTAYFRSLPFATSATNETTAAPRLVGATFSGYVSALLGNSRSGFYLLEISSGGAFSPLTVSDLASSDGTVTLQYFV